MRSGLVSLVLFTVGAGCAPEPPTSALFAVPGESVGDDFYALPFPNDLRRDADGTIDLSEFPTNSLIVESYRAAADQLDGFGLNAPIFVRFSDGIDPASLPDPAGAITDTASVYLVDVDPDSPARGTRTPLLVRFRDKGTDTLGPMNLVARPYPGFGLRDATTYALVVTSRVIDWYGAPVTRSRELAALVGTGGSPSIVHAREVYQPLLDWLDEDGGDARDAVVSAAVFTTQHATPIVPAIRKGVYGTPAPLALSLGLGGIDLPEYTDYNGTYAAPNFQRGEVPYRQAGGDIVVDPSGAAVVQRMEPMRFAITVPKTPMPTAGYPIAIYAHGTGGDFRSFISDGTAYTLAKQGIATISTDQVLHGPRNPGGNAEVDFFNFENPLAARDNALQGAADAFSQHRLALGLSFTERPEVKFDPANVFFFGHSQGGSTGPGFVAFEPTLRGAVMSGTAGLITVALLEKTEPLDIPGLLTSLLRDDPVDADNPSIGLVQMWMERADPNNYAPLMVRTPPIVDGVTLAPRNIFQTEGFTDHYSPNVGIEAFAVALGADIALDPDHADVLGVALRGRKTVATPITDNYPNATCVLAQFKQKSGSDGHFVVFDIDLARTQAAEFLGTLARTGKATVVSGP
ncbi:MAG: hypothetical protein NT062_30550 [Proteobacteria bacterium]|nr:hypothetical protein [Pseudomonadota bacterium]